MITRLSDGDIIIQFERKLKEKKLDKLQDEIASTAIHGLIYNNLKVYHSVDSEHQMGVRSHDIQHILNPRLSLGTALVFHMKDGQIRENIANSVVKWDPLRDPLIYSEAKKRKDKHGINILPIPFVNVNLRKKDEGKIEEKQRFELFRAFRAYKRNQEEVALSKNKGVSCGNFVSYSIKVGLIKKLFPKGLPNEIQQKINSIESKKTPDKRKLSDINSEELIEFEKLILENLASIHMEEKNVISISDLLQELYRIVKSRTIGDFCHDAFQHPAVWDFSGHVFYRESSNKELEAWIMPHNLYLQFIDKFNKHKLIVSDKELLELGINVELLEQKSFSLKK